jgi:hypothetical protein
MLDDPPDPLAGDPQARARKVDRLRALGDRYLARATNPASFADERHADDLLDCALASFALADDVERGTWSPRDDAFNHRVRLL